MIIIFNNIDNFKFFTHSAGMETRKLAYHRMNDRKDPAYCKKVIRDLGLKVTQQRLIILEEIFTGRDHVTAQEVFESVSTRNSEIGFATVYRFLRTLSDQGYLTELRMRGLPARYEWAQKQHHDHLTCLSCGLICEFENEKIEELQNQMAEKHGFQLTDHVLELYGYCSKCQKVQNTRHGAHRSPAAPSNSRTG